MPRIEITKDCGEIKLGDKLLPGILAGISISGDVKIKEEEAEGSSSKFKQALGWNDISLSLTLILPNDEQSDPYTKAKELVGIFRKTDKTAKPEVYRIVNKLTEAWGLDKVLVKDLKIDDNPNADYLRATLTIVEWESPLVKVEARAVNAPQVDRTATMPTIAGSATSEVEGWQQKPTEGTYKDTIEVPDDE